MRITKFVVTVLGILGLGAGGVSYTVEPVAAQEFSEDELCEQALEIGTIEALERFIRKYPDNETACNALAQLGPSGNSPGGPSGGSDGGYGG